MEGLDPPATITRETADTALPNQLQHLVATAVREVESISRRNAESLESTRKELLEALDHVRKEGEETRKLLNKVLEHLAKQSAPTVTYASAAMGNGLTQPRRPSGETANSNPTPAHTAPQTTNPRAETDIRVRIKKEAAKERLAQITSEEMVKAINWWLKTEGNEGRAVAVKQVRSGNIVVATETRENKQNLLSNTGWVQTLDVKAEINTPTYLVLLHGVRIKAIDMDSPEQAIEELTANNSQLLENTNIKKISWSKTPLPAGKEYTSIVVGFESPGAANRAIIKGMIMEHRILSCELFDINCRKKQCYRCQKYGHIFVGCRNPVSCNYCSGHHPSSSCADRGKQKPPKCAACGEKGYPAWNKSCSQSIAENEKVTEARSTRPMLHNEEEENHKKTQQRSTEEQKENTEGQKKTDGEKSGQPIEYTPSQPKGAKARPKDPIKQSTQATKASEPRLLSVPDTEKVTAHYVSSQGRSCTPSAKAQQSEWKIITGRKRKSSHSLTQIRRPMGELHPNTRMEIQPQTCNILSDEEQL